MSATAACARRPSAAPSPSSAPSQKTAFRVTRGTISYFFSSDIARRGFCSACGTPLLFEYPEDGDDLGVMVGTLDEPDRAPPRTSTATKAASPGTAACSSFPATTRPMPAIPTCSTASAAPTTSTPTAIRSAGHDPANSAHWRLPVRRRSLSRRTAPSPMLASAIVACARRPAAISEWRILAPLS